MRPITIFWIVGAMMVAVIMANPIKPYRRFEIGPPEPNVDLDEFSITMQRRIKRMYYFLRKRMSLDLHKKYPGPDESPPTEVIARYEQDLQRMLDEQVQAKKRRMEGRIQAKSASKRLQLDFKERKRIQEIENEKRYRQKIEYWAKQSEKSRVEIEAMERDLEHSRHNKSDAGRITQLERELKFKRRLKQRADEYRAINEIKTKKAAEKAKKASREADALREKLKIGPKNPAEEVDGKDSPLRTDFSVDEKPPESGILSTAMQSLREKFDVIESMSRPDGSVSQTAPFFPIKGPLAPFRPIK